MINKVLPNTNEFTKLIFKDESEGIIDWWLIANGEISDPFIEISLSVL